MSVTYRQLSGEEVSRLLEKIEDVVIGERKDTITVACLTFALLLQNPTLEPERIVEGVKGVSEWLACFVADVDGTKAC